MLAVPAARRLPPVKSPRCRFWFALVGGALLLAALLIIPPVTATAAEAARSKVELEQLRRSIDDLQHQLAAEGRREKSVAGEVEQLERQLSTLAAERRTETARLRQVKAGKAKLETRRSDLQARILHSREHLVKMARASYRLGRQSGLKLILSQHTPAQASRALAIFRYLSKARSRSIAADRKLRRELVDTRAELEQQRRQLDEVLARLAENRAQLDAKHARREGHLVELRAQMREGREQMAVFTRREEELERLLSRLQRPHLAADSDVSVETAASIVLSGFNNNKGNLAVPVRGRIAARYGQRKEESGLKWEGLMFEADEGREVVAIYPGQVIFSDWFPGYGQLMVLDHGDGYMSLYGHNRALHAGLGASVDVGERIGEAGATGGLSHAGLYFEIRHNGKPHNPLEWCRI